MTASPLGLPLKARRAHSPRSSPDDARIAVSVFDYAQRPPIVHLSVGPLTGPLTEIYASASNYVWPVGWHAGKLVPAAQSRPPFAQQMVLFNPYGARSHHVVDPASAERVATVGNPEDTSGGRS